MDMQSKKRMTLKFIQLLSISTLLSLSTLGHAGFGESLRELRGTLSELSQTAKEISGVGKEVGLTSNSGKSNKQQENSDHSVGQTLYPKVNNLSLYQSSSKSSSVIKKLSKNTDLIFSGQAQNGLMKVTTEHGDGWVESHLVH